MLYGSLNMVGGQLSCDYYRMDGSELLAGNHYDLKYKPKNPKYRAQVSVRKGIFQGIFRFLGLNFIIFIYLHSLYYLPYDP